MGLSIYNKIKKNLFLQQKSLVLVATLVVAVVFVLITFQGIRFFSFNSEACASAAKLSRSYMVTAHNVAEYRKSIPPIVEHKSACDYNKTFLGYKRKHSKADELNYFKYYYQKTAVEYAFRDTAYKESMKNAILISHKLNPKSLSDQEINQNIVTLEEMAE